MNRGNLKIVKREYPFVRMAKGVLLDRELTPQAKLVWAIMCDICNNEKYRQRFHFSDKTIAGLLGWGESTAAKYKNELIKAGYLVRMPAGTKTIKGGLEYDYLLYADRGNDIEQSKEIIKEAFTKADIAEFMEELDKTPDRSNLIPMEAIIVDKEQNTNNSTMSKEWLNKAKIYERGGINKNYISYKDSNNIVDSNSDIKNNNIDCEKSTREKQGFVGNSDTKFKKEFVMCEITDFEIFQLFGKFGFTDFHKKGDSQQIQFYAMANVIKNAKKRLVNRSEIIALLMFQKNVLGVREKKSYRNQEVIDFVAGVLKHKEQLQEVIDSGSDK